MILHGRYDEPSDSLAQIKLALELEETVTALAETGLEPDLYGGNVRVARPGMTNYVVGHGMAGLFADQPFADRFAAELVARGLRGGDRLTVIGCFTGERQGFAEQVADELGRLGIVGVAVRGPQEYIHWTRTGPVLVTAPYPANARTRAAQAAYNKAEERAWSHYVNYLKACSIKVATIALATSPAIVFDRLDLFAAARPETNQRELRRHLAAGRTAGTGGHRQVDQAIKEAARVRIVTTRGETDRERSNALFSSELHSLLTDLYLLAAPADGRQRAARRIDKARERLRKPLEEAWPVYSADYFDEIRALVGEAGPAQWRQYSSAYSVPAVTVEEDAGGADLGPAPEIDAFLHELELELGRL